MRALPANRLRMLILWYLFLCVPSQLQGGEPAERFRVIRDVLLPRLLVAQERAEAKATWRPERFLWIRPKSSVLIKLSLQKTDLEKLAPLGKALCVGTRIVNPIPAPSTPPVNAWRTTPLHLTIEGDQWIETPAFDNPPKARHTIRLAVLAQQTDCPRGGEVTSPSLEAPRHDILVRTMDQAGWKLTVADATLVVGKTSLPDLADGTDRSLQTFRVGANAFPFAETHSLRGQWRNWRAWMGWLGVGGNLSLLDFNQNGSNEPGVGIVLAPAPLHRTVFVGIGWNLVQPSRAVFDPSQPNNLIHLQDRRYVFIGVSGLGLKNWIERKKKGNGTPATPSHEVP
jgi:hypothetical protein